MRKSNFTLIELIVVIAILGILSAMIVPNLSNFTQDAQEIRKGLNIRNVQTASDMYNMKTDSYPTNAQPIYSNEKIIWNKLYPKYIKSIPKLPPDENYYINPEGVVMLNYNSDAEFLKWLKNSTFIVEDSLDPSYNGLNPPVGAVFLNYNKQTQQFVDYKGDSIILTLSVAMTGDSLLQAYKATNDTVFLDRAKLIGNYLKTKIYQEQLYGQNIYKITGMTKYNTVSSSWEDLNGETHSKDIAISAKFLVELGMLSGDTSYATEGKKLLDTLCTVQDIVGNDAIYSTIDGALPYYLTAGGMNWIAFPLDIGYMIYDAGDIGYKYFKEEKYNNMKNRYFSFSEKAFSTLNGLTADGYPYEYIVYKTNTFYGENNNQAEIGSPWGTNQPFTTDQFFYTVLGLMKSGSPRTTTMYNLATNLINTDYEFWGQYNTDGTKEVNSYIETCNTAFYLQMVKQHETDKVSDIQNKLISSMEISVTDVNVQSAWAWAPGEDYIESLVSALAAQKILEQ